MIRALVDTNVLVDFLARREPFYPSSRRLMVFAAMGDYELWMSSSQVTDLYYILTNGGRKDGAESCKAAMRGLRRVVRVAAPGEREVDTALDSPWSDFEDAFVCQTAIGIRAQAIITRNLEDFAQAPPPIFDVGSFFEWMRRTHRVSYEELGY
jgi:predicted nucleic acid-binding protein